MEKIDILLWVIGGGFGLMLIMWNHLTSSIREINVNLSHTNEKIAEIDKRLYGIETVLHMKDCCVLKQDQNFKKAE